MKKIILLLFGALVALPAICQIDTIFVLQSADVRLLPIKLRKATKVEVSMGMQTVYIPETDVNGGNVINTKSAVIIYQTPMSAQPTQGQLDQISAAIKNILEPTTGPTPDVVTMIDNLPGQGITYSPATNLGINVFNGAGWYHFKSNPPTITWPDPAVGQSLSVLNVAGFVEIDINGYKFEWHTEKRINHGIATISVDGGAPVDVDLYDPTTTNNTRLVYTWTDPGGTNKPHKVRISFTGRKNPAATENNIIHDALKVYSKQ